MSGMTPNNNTANAATNLATATNGRTPVPPRWVHYETDLSSVLAFAPRNELLAILQIADPTARTYCERLGIWRGDRVTRVDGRKDDVLLTLDDGRRVRVALPVALLIEVEPALPS